jgi:hypothetical protein
MKLKGTSKLDAQKFPEAQPWIIRLFNQLNEVIGSMFLALTNNLTFSDNMSCEIKEYTFTHGVELQGISYSLKSYLGVFIINTPEDTSSATAITAFKFRRFAASYLAGYIEFKGGAGTTGKIKFIILGE